MWDRKCEGEREVLKDSDREAQRKMESERDTKQMYGKDLYDWWVHDRVIEGVSKENLP